MHRSGPQSSTTVVTSTVTKDQEDAHRRTAELDRRESRLQQWEQDLRIRQRKIDDWERDHLSNGIGEPVSETSETKIHSATSLASYFASGRFLRSFVFGGLDGLTTTMVLVCSVSGIGQRNDPSIARIPAGVIFTLGAANAIADAFSMGMGELLSSLADGDTEGTSLASKIDAVRNGVVMFLSFIFFGFGPLLAYVSFFPWKATDERLRAAWILCTLGLFLLGVLKAHVTTSGSARTLCALGKQGLTMVCTGGIASALSYVISTFLHRDVPPLEGPPV